MPPQNLSPLSIAIDAPATNEPELLWWNGRPRSSRGTGVAALTAIVQAPTIEGARSALNTLDGSFALAWRARWGAVLLATDRFAVESLCWRVVGDHLVVGARADALAAIEPAAPVAPQALFDFLYFHVIPSPRTAFEGVHRLPAGKCLSVRASEVATSSYFQARFSPSPSGSFAELKENFSSLLLDAVRDCANSLGPRVGCYLSGGTDSSTVAGMLARARGTGTDAFSIGFAADGYDEMAYARIAARHFQCRHHEHYVTTAELTRDLPKIAAHFDQPFGNSSALPAYLCASMARETGVTSLLAGDGGDELFGGNARYAKQRLFSHYATVPGALRRGLLEPLFMTEWAQSFALTRKAKSYIEQARKPMPERAELYNLLLRTGVDTVLEPDFRRLVDESSTLQQQRAVWEEPAAEDELNRNLAFDWRYTLAECDVPKVVESARMASVLVDFPLLDGRLLEFSMQLPVRYKLRGSQLRWFFKEALSDFLPKQILQKQKHGFGLPFGVWCLQDPALNALAADCLNSVGKRGVVRSGFAADLLSKHLPEHPGYYGEFVWILCVLELWLQAHRPKFAIG